MRATLETIPDGDAGLAVKLRRLRGLVDTGRADPRLRQVALRLVQHVPERSWSREIQAVSDFTRRLRYTRDPVGVELFTDPRLLLAGVLDGTGAGDCDDHVALGAALLEAIGHPTRFVVGGFSRARQSPAWAHIWLQVLDPAKGWRTIDDTAKHRPAGYDPAQRFDTVTAEQTTMAQPARRLCYGGAAALQGLGDLGGFKLKKLARKITRPVARVIPKPIRRAAAPISRVVRKVSSATYNVATRVAPFGSRSFATKLLRTQIKMLPTTLPIAANIVAPGSGAIVSTFFSDPINHAPATPLAPQFSPPPSLEPSGPPSSFAAYEGAGSSFTPAEYGGGGGARRGRGAGAGVPSWVLPTAIAAGGGLVLLLLLRRRR